MNHIEFIRVLGGVTKVSKICGISKGAVSQWKRSGIPRAQMNFLKTKFPRQYRETFKQPSHD
ncbi:Cro/CI family transcriptional regulator [Neisseria bacilliformis]|jgi:hypothetical protein|uniref:Cro/CI family transcriptional regulator n=1 Tax=Neisseria bacilliformis TaxID=267212 RepID=UPI0028E2FA48|nr:Cro/CI family transcriptional regulator [Neisseria bacilliformis]